MASYLSGEIERYCRMRSGLDDDAEEPFATDEDGFLVGPTEIRESRLPGAIVLPEVAARAGSLVLLGEPGVGKSTVFIRLAESFAGSIYTINAVALTDATYDAMVGLPLTSSDREPITVVIDQLDESVMLDRLAHRLLAAKREIVRSVRFLVACRTAEFPQHLTDVLAELSGGCAVADLAPLTREQALALLVGHSFEPSDVIDAAIAIGAGALASVPLTLELLARVFEADGALPQRAADVFSKAVERLAEHPDRPSAATVARQRVVISSRAATRMLLSNRRTLWSGPQLDAAPGDLDVGSLVGGTESLPGGEFEVTRTGVRETIASALFTGRGDHRFAFRHSTIAAFLAARHLASLGLPETQLRQLLLTTDESTVAGIAMPLRQVATWLVALDPVRHGWLARTDPEGLAAYTAIVESNDVRRVVVEGLLERAPALELTDRGWQRARWNLRHAKLADQLSPILRSAAVTEPSDWDTKARVRLAIRLAEAARSPELADPLLWIAEGDGSAPHVRRAAAAAAYVCDQNAAVARLAALLARFQQVEWASVADPDDELRGELLDVLWPAHIKTRDVLGQLRPRRRTNLIGSYSMFLRRFGTSLRGEDLAEVLTWAIDRSASAGVTEPNEPSADTASYTVQYSIP